jgi:hypothetical protein
MEGNCVDTAPLCIFEIGIRIACAFGLTEAQIETSMSAMVS